MWTNNKFHQISKEFEDEMAEMALKSRKKREVVELGFP
jgi:hypothetical protein